MPNLIASRKCAEWLSECLRLGWPKDSLDQLQALWWEHHDEQGKLFPAPVTAAEAKEE